MLNEFYKILMEQDSESLVRGFAATPRISDPLAGTVEGLDAIRDYVADRSRWLESGGARVELLSEIVTSERRIAEFVLYLDKLDPKVDLPVAVVADLEAEGWTWIRVYHSTWPLNGKHLLRSPLLKQSDHLEEPRIIQQYMEAIGPNPSVEAVLALFEANAYVREPSGSQYKYEGPEAREKFYTMALQDGGVSLKHCTATFDGKCFAVEFNADGWGPVDFQPQAGMAIYELGPTQKILAVRIYDDVTPPSE